MRQAGYGPAYVKRFGGEMVAKLREYGLLPTVEEVREIKDLVLEVLREYAVPAARTLGQTAAGETEATPAERTAAAKEVLARAAGPIPRRHELSIDEAGAVLDELLALAPGVLGDVDAADRLAAAWREHLAKRKAGGR